MTKIYMEKLNQTNLDKLSCKNFIKNLIHDLEWIEVFNKIIDQCIDNLPFYTKMLQQINKLKEEDCDLRYQAYITCANLLARKVRKVLIT